MFRDIPDDTLNLLQGIYNQPDHTVASATLSSFDIPALEERIQFLLDHQLIDCCGLEIMDNPNYIGLRTTNLHVTAAGADLLKEMHSLEDRLAQAEKYAKQQEERANHLADENAKLKSTRHKKDFILSIVSACVGAAINALSSAFLPPLFR